MSGTGLVHGTANGYDYYKCHCEKCKKAKREYMAEWNKKHPGRTAARQREWSSRNQDKRAATRKRWSLKNPELSSELTWRSQRAQQSKTLDKAHNRCQRWTDWEIEIAEQSELPAMEVALMIGRTYSAVVAMRSKLRRKEKKV